MISRIALLQEEVRRLTEELETAKADLVEMTWRFNNPDRFNHL